MRYPFVVAASFVAAAVATPVSAHVTLEVGQAVAGSYYKATFRVPHGCAGAATTALRIKIPDGVSDVKPQPKPGWKMDVVKTKLDQPMKSGEHGGTVLDRVSEVSFSGNKLADDNYDEFAIFVVLPAAPGTTIYFPVVQECETGATRWIEIPANGKTSADYREPAPGLKLIPKP